MIVEPEQLEPIVNGKLREVVITTRPPEQGTFQAIQGAVGRNATCTVHIDEVVHNTQGGWIVRFHLAQDIPARFLGRAGGYTSQPAYALSDGHRAEPEAVDEAYQAKLTSDAHTRTQRRRQKTRQEQDMLSLEDKVKAYRAEAAHKRIDIGKELRTLRKLEQRGKKTDAQVHVIRRKLDTNQNAREAA